MQLDFTTRLAVSARTLGAACCFLCALPVLAQDDAAAVSTIPVQTETALEASNTAGYSYTFALARLRHTELDRGSTDNFGIEGSYLLLPEFYAVAAVLTGESDDGTADTTQFELGAGYRKRITTALDLNASLRILHLDVDTAQDSRIDQGYQFDIGARGILWQQLETSAGISYVDVARSSKGFLVASALYPVWQQLNIGVEARASSSTTAYGLLGRWDF